MSTREIVLLKNKSTSCFEIEHEEKRFSRILGVVGKLRRRNVLFVILIFLMEGWAGLGSTVKGALESFRKLRGSFVNFVIMLLRGESGRGRGC